VAWLKLGAGDRVATRTGGQPLAAGQTAIVTIRPERIALERTAPSGGDACHAAGTVRESLYAGPTSRFVVDLDGGGELMVVRQNVSTTHEDAEALRGRPVVLVWERDYTRLIGTSEEGSQ
jgi:putative spermidine/putrescine transport system ATP-binding protein